MSNLYYSDNWKDLDHTLVYQSPNFAFNSKIIITEFEECLIKKLSAAKMYHKMDPKNIEIYDMDFQKELMRSDHSIVIISNFISNNGLTTDMIKSKLETYVEVTKIPVLAFFMLKANKLSKPHTGAWKLLRAYYKKYGISPIKSAIVVGEYGGQIMEEELKNGKNRVTLAKSDVDRAFAHNIGVPFKTVNEFLHPSKTEKFMWNVVYLTPEDRARYISQLAEEWKNPNIFAKIVELGQPKKTVVEVSEGTTHRLSIDNYADIGKVKQHVPITKKVTVTTLTKDTFLILVYGAPRSGKSTYCNDIVNKWNNTEFSKTKAIRILNGMSTGKKIKETEKLFKARISVIIDGECHTDKLRCPYLNLANTYKIPVIVVEINPGLHMARIFNHVAVEMAASDDVNLYNDREYHIYKSEVKRPKGVLLYSPQVKDIPEILSFRY